MEQQTVRKKNRHGLQGLIIAIIVILVLFVCLIGFITDFLWFKELHYVSVFFTKLFTQLKIGIPTFVVVTFLAYIYLKFLKRGYFKKINSTELTNHKRLNLISWGLAGLFGLVTTYTAVTRLWFQALQFKNSTNFNIKDPLYKMDISFYTFRLNFIQGMNQLIIMLLIAFAILTVAYYAILLAVRTPTIFTTVEDGTSGSSQAEQEEEEEETGGFNPGNGFDSFGDIFGKFAKNFSGGAGGGQNPFQRQRKPKKQLDRNNLHILFSIAEKQLIIVGFLFFLMIGVNFFLKQYTLLYDSTGTVYGAGFTAVTITLWMYRVLIVLSVAAAIGFAIGIKQKKVKPAAIMPIIMIVIGLIGGGLSMVVQNLVVTPDEINKESKYLEYNIKYTQHAYGLDQVDMRAFKAEQSLTAADIKNNSETISNIRINDYAPANTFYNQTQSIRPYYTFNDVDVDRYMINGEYTQTFLSAREIDEEKISDTWLNRHLKYTHGYGITLSRVDKITASGQPDMLIDSIPPISRVEEINLNTPEIYFGELTNDYTLVNTSEDEFDYPDGNSNKYTQYHGKAGIKMNPLNRFMFAVREKSLKTLVSGNINGNSKILINRNIIKRIQEIMPYLEYDKDPYMITENGKLYWIIDAYTATDKYPYSAFFAV